MGRQTGRVLDFKGLPDNGCARRSGPGRGPERTVFSVPTPYVTRRASVAQQIAVHVYAPVNLGPYPSLGDAVSRREWEGAARDNPPARPARRRLGTLPTCDRLTRSFRIGDPSSLRSSFLFLHGGWTDPRTAERPDTSSVATSPALIREPPTPVPPAARLSFSLRSNPRSCRA